MMDWLEQNRRKAAGFDVSWARTEARERHGRTHEQARDLRHQAAQSATCCGECFRPLSATDSVTMVTCNIGRRRNPYWLRVPICLDCTLDGIKLWRFGRNEGFYETPRWHRTRCLNCSRPLRVYPQPRHMFSTRPLLSRNARTCCADCQRAVRNKSNNLRRRVRHEPMACIECGRSFVPKRADATTCSNKCRQALHRSRTSAVASSIRHGRTRRRPRHA
jgi:hypothetical protein